MRGNKAITPEWCRATFMEYSEMYVMRKQLAQRAMDNLDILEESGMDCTEAVPIVEREIENRDKYFRMVDVVLDLYNKFCKEDLT
jgi:hypothetical protein